MRAKALLAAVLVCLPAVPALADEDDVASHAEAVTRLVMERDIQVGYDYVATLMRLPNAFGEGAACVLCHGSNDPKRSYRGLDLTSCEGIVRGATEPPARPILTPGQGRAGLLWRYLQHNRMPFGVEFDYQRDTENIRLVRATTTSTKRSCRCSPSRRPSASRPLASTVICPTTATASTSSI
jgi:hypothetical protein